MGALKDKVVLVTGASRGIGAAIAKRFACEGAELAITARTLAAHDHLPGSLDETARSICDAGCEGPLVVLADLSQADERARMFDAVADGLGPIDILINNAAANFFLPFENISPKRYNIMFAINCAAPFDLCQRAIPAMRQAGQGWIVNISTASAALPAQPFSEHDIHGHPLLYGMSKAALDRFSVGLAAEFSGSGVVVNALSPTAAVATPGVLALGKLPPREMIEGEELMAEAALALSCCAPEQVNGRVVDSQSILRELGIRPRTLDGKAEYDGRIPSIDD